MLISLSKNITFLAMPKAASTSIEHALLPHCEIAFLKNPRVKHIRYRRYKRFILPFVDKSGFGPLETTCLFREPVDWLFSWYKYRSRKQIAHRPQSTAEITFEDFVLRHIDQEPKVSDFGRSSQFVSDHDGSVGVDHVFRYDNMNAYTDFLSERFGVEIELERKNESPARQFSLSSTARSQLQTFLAPEFEIYESAR